MAAGLSFEYDQLTSFQVRKRIAYIRGERVRVRLVCVGQFANDLAQHSPVAAGKNFVRSFV